MLQKSFLNNNQNNKLVKTSSDNSSQKISETDNEDRYAVINASLTFIAHLNDLEVMLTGTFDRFSELIPFGFTAADLKHSNNNS